MTTTTRREILRILTVAASASALGLSGCDSDSNSPDPGTPQGNGAIVPSEALYPQGVASGDPRPDAVVLWTRFVESDRNADVTLRLQVSTSDTFAQLLVNHDFTARAAADGCLKVRVTGLTAATRYFYRFLLSRNGDFLASATGRTRTARALTDATPVKFAAISCNDYIGRYFTTLMPLLNEDLDFVLHLGDSIYETTGDPSFQGGAAARAIVFDDREGAITLGTAGSTYQAAKSLDNYRQLHRTYRNDGLMRQLYQRFPVVAIWDDHEFSDDSWKAMGTYRDGLFEELDEERRRNAEQAYFEFMPVDTDLGGAQGALGVERAHLYPRATLYRKLRFGRDLELFLSDYRSYRPDHLIPEDAFPGAVVMDRAALTQFFAAQNIPYDAVRSQFSPYLDIDQPQYAVYKQVLQATLTQAYLNEGIDLGQAALRAQNAARGFVATTILNSLLQQYNAAVPPAQRVPLIPDALIATLDTGMAWYTLGKTSLFGSVGSRYFVVEQTFKIYAGWLAMTRGPQVQNALGDAQLNWLGTQMAASTAKWKVLASSVSTRPLVLDLTPPPLGVPAPFNQRFLLNVDQWDGFPQGRQALMARLPAGSVILSGDIHATLVGGEGLPGQNGMVAEFTTPAVSSASFRQLLANTAANDPLLAPLAAQLLPALDQLIAPLGLSYVQTTRPGHTVLDSGPTEFKATIRQYDPAVVLAPPPTTAPTPQREIRFNYDGMHLAGTNPPG
ncbi:MAG TPA: alkaline phosphatase D family protein [Patescibacteria group bacterium]|nr:alkaline phosphatase D family protein [Patescibacteria group bacterium]